MKERNGEADDTESMPEYFRPRFRDSACMENAS